MIGTTITAPPRAPKTAIKRAAGEDGRLRFATANGAPDNYCHWLVSRSRTLCGQTRNPPLERMHKAAPCPNGNPPCPECTRIAQAWGTT